MRKFHDHDMSISTRTRGFGLEYTVELSYWRIDNSNDSEAVARHQYTEPDVLAITADSQSKTEFWNSLIEEFEEWPKDITPIDLSFHDATYSMHFPFVRYAHLDDEDKLSFDDMLESFMQTKDMDVYASCF